MLRSYQAYTVKLGSCCKKHWQKYQLHKVQSQNGLQQIPILSLDMKLFHIISMKSISIRNTDWRNKNFSSFNFAFIQRHKMYCIYWISLHNLMVEFLKEIAVWRNIMWQQTASLKIWHIIIGNWAELKTSNKGNILS